MKTTTIRPYRYLVIALLVAAGVVTTISSGGGGGGNSFNPPGGTGPTLRITADNGDDVASALIIAIGGTFDFGDISEGEVVVANSPSTLRFSAGLLSRTQAFSSGTIFDCGTSGTVDITATVTDPNRPTVGDRIVLVFDACDDGVGYTLDGAMDLTVAALQGDPLTDVFLIGFDVLMTNLTVTDGTTVETADGDFRLTLDSLAFPVIGTTIMGNELTLARGLASVTLIDFNHQLTADTGASLTEIQAEVFGRMLSTALGGSVDYETTLPVRAVGELDPHEGELLVSGAGGTSVNIVIVDSTHVTLEIDGNGDGVVDQFVDTTWSELNGNSPPTGNGSTIDPSNVSIVAREVHNATGGFGSLALVAGSQFSPNGAFGQIQLQGLSGSFGPVTVNCAVSGTAEVSGTIAAGGTFTPGDSLQAIFTACVRGTEKLDGLLEVTVDSYLGTAGSFYSVTASATETGLRRGADGTCFFGLGTYHTLYDLGLTTPGVIQANSDAITFNVTGGGRTQVVDNATVSAQIQTGQTIPSVTRDSSGTMTGTDLTGSFGYFSIVPDVFVVDGDPVTGVSSGELLVTAGDGSTLRLVAVDDLNVRLDADYDADGTIDAQILTPWIDLSHGNAFGICD